MNRFKNAALLLTVLVIAACSADSPSAPLPVVPKGGANLTTYATLDAEINATIPTLFRREGFEDVTQAGWLAIKLSLRRGRVDIARKLLINLSTFIVKTAKPSQKTATSRLILLMSLYVYNGPATPPPGTPGASLQTVAGVVEPNTELTLTTMHVDGVTVGDGGIHLDVGSVATTTIAVISEVTGDYTADCSGPFIYSGCQEPKFFRITLFPHDKLLKPGKAQICHVNRGEIRRPIGDHDDLRVAHEKPPTPALYTRGGTIVEGIEILPFDETINFLTSAGGCTTTYAVNESPEPKGFLARLVAPGAPLTRFASAIGSMLTPKSLEAIDLGGGGLFESESIFGLVNPKIKITDGCVTAPCANPVIALKNVEEISGGTRHNLTVTNRSVYPTQIFAASPSLPPCGLNTSASRTWVTIHDGSTGAVLNTFCALGSPADLDGIWYFVPTDASGPATIYVKLTDRLTLRVYQSNTIPAVDSPKITSLSLDAPSIRIGNEQGTNFRAVVNNPGTSSTGWVLQGWIDQGSTVRAAGGTDLNCPDPEAPSRTLPAGTCNGLTFSLNASNAGQGTGTLVPGPATYRLQLIQGDTVIDTRTVPIELISLTGPAIMSLTLDSPSITIGGAGTNYQAVVDNPGPEATNYDLQGWVVQGVAIRAAGGTSLTCGSGVGVLPAGTCNMSFSVATNNTTAGGSGTLVPGNATFRLELRLNGTAVYTKNIPIILQNP